MEFKTMKFEIDGRIARLAFNRPKAANGFNLQMLTDLSDAAKLAASNNDIKAVILTGEGAFFSAGGDVHSMNENMNNLGAAVKTMTQAGNAAIKTFSEMEVPLICAVNGMAAGAGFSMAIAGDIVVAAESAKFTIAYSGVGLSPDGSSTYYLPRLIGLRRTQELMYTNRVLSAKEAQQWGLVHECVPDDELLTRADEIANIFVNGSRKSNATIKSLLYASEHNSLDQQMELEGDSVEICANGHDGREGVKAFIERRQPMFE